MKKILSVLLIGALLASLLIVGDVSKNRKIDENKDTDENRVQTVAAEKLKIGVILMGDETESYSKAHIDGMKAAVGELGISEQNIEWKERIEESGECYDAAKELAEDGCKLIISTNYSQQDGMADAAEEFPEVKFVSISGQYAAISGLDNYYNAYADVYEACYVSGVVAGMKIAELDKQKKIPDEGYDISGNVKVGYIGTFPNAEVVSGYTAFYLGIKSVFAKVVMDVQYTNAWFDIDAEATAADALLKSGCILISQHADSTGAAQTVENAWKNGQQVYYVGYNANTLDVAPNATLTSTVCQWSVYYKQLLKAVLKGREIPQDWAEGLKSGAVAITDLGPKVAKGTEEKVKKVETAIEDGKLHVFDTSAFTVNGKEITSADAMVDLSYIDPATGTAEYEGNRTTALVLDHDKTYFDESALRSAPYFTFRIDGITELNVGEN